MKTVCADVMFFAKLSNHRAGGFCHGGMVAPPPPRPHALRPPAPALRAVIPHSQLDQGVNFSLAPRARSHARTSARTLRARGPGLVRGEGCSSFPAHIAIPLTLLDKQIWRGLQ